MEQELNNQVEDVERAGDDMASIEDAVIAPPEMETTAFDVEIPGKDGRMLKRHFTLKSTFTLEMRAFARQMGRKAAEYLRELGLPPDDGITLQDCIDFVCGRPQLVRKAMTLGWVGDHGGIDWARDIELESVEVAVTRFFVEYNNSQTTKTE